MSLVAIVVLVMGITSLGAMIHTMLHTRGCIRQPGEHDIIERDDIASRTRRNRASGNSEDEEETVGMITAVDSE